MRVLSVTGLCLSHRFNGSIQSLRPLVEGTLTISINSVLVMRAHEINARADFHPCFHHSKRRLKFISQIPTDAFLNATTHASYPISKYSPLDSPGLVCKYLEVVFTSALPSVYLKTQCEAAAVPRRLVALSNNYLWRLATSAIT